jgi:hypothetical protein
VAHEEREKTHAIVKSSLCFIFFLRMNVYLFYPASHANARSDDNGQNAHYEKGESFSCNIKLA